MDDGSYWQAGSQETRDPSLPLPAQRLRKVGVLRKRRQEHAILWLRARVIDSEAMARWLAKEKHGKQRLRDAAKLIAAEDPDQEEED